MSNIEWTSAQKRAIDYRDSGVVVSAAAGSGKTAVLIERLTQMLLDEKNKIPAENLVAVTFTTDAAAQMKDKLNDAFDKEINKCFGEIGSLETPKAKWLLEQKSNLQFAVISTINSFCFSFVKDHISKFDFQSGLRILDETTGQMYFEKARDIALAELCENDEPKYEILRNAFDSVKNKLESVLYSLYKFMRTLPFREIWVEQARLAYKDENMINNLIRTYKENIVSDLDLIEKNIEQMNLLIGKIPDIKQANTLRNSLTKACFALGDMLGDVRKAFASGELKRYLESVNTKNKLKKPSLGSVKYLDGADPYELSILTDVCKQAEDIFESTKKIFNNLETNGLLSDHTIRDNLADILNVFDILVEVVYNIEYHCHEMKLESNSVEFSDVELMTKQLLVEYKQGSIVRTPLCEEIRKNKIYRIITIDEFQDVNNLQELIFRALSDSDDLEYMGKNAFIVGDIKQAIYRFRLTNPYLFVKTVKDAQNKCGGLELIDLQENFRSRKGVIDFANFLFSNILFEQIGGVKYDESQELHFGAKSYPQVSDSDKNSNVEILLMNEHDDFNSENFSEENLLVAKKIKEILEPSSGYTVMDKDSKQMRQCRPSDICILMQKNDEIRRMSKALEAVGLKAFSQDVEGYLKASEITLVLNILRVIDNPMNDIAMTSVLMSPVFSFDATQMLTIHSQRIRKNRNFPSSIYSVLSNAHLSFIDKKTEDITYDRVFDDDPVLQKKCSEAFVMLDNFAYRSMSTDLERLIRYIFEATDLIALTSIYLDSDKKRANLLLFMQYAKAYEGSGNEGVSGFLRFIDSVFKNEKAFKQAAKITSSGDCINIQTYHKSKGLEYPYVFLCELTKSITHKNDEEIVMHYKISESEDDLNSFAFEISDEKLHIKKTNPYFKLLHDQNVIEEKSEKMRLLYVGCTRAKEKLFISCSPNHNRVTNVVSAKRKLAGLMLELYADSTEQNVHSFITKCNSMLEWIFCGLTFANCGSSIVNWLVDPENTESESKSFDTDLMKDKLTDLFCDPRKTELKADIKIIELDKPENNDKAHAQTVMATPDPVLANKLKIEYLKRENAIKDTLNIAMLPSKLTVTEIVSNENEKIAVKSENQNGEYAVNINPDFFPSLPKLDESSSRFTAAQRGTFTHKFMELADYNNAVRSVSDELNRLVTHGFFTEAEAKGVYVDKLDLFFASRFYKRMHSASEIIREKQFMVAMKDICIDDKYRSITGNEGIIQGIADCVFKEPDGYVIVDYKTDNFQSESDMEKYSTQLAFYKAALELILGEELPDGTIKKAVIKSCYIYSFMLGIGKEFVFNE